MEAHPFQTRSKDLERARQAQALLDDLLVLTELTDDERACMVARRAMASKGQEVLERRAARLGMLLEDLDETLAQLSPALASTTHEFGVTWSDWIIGRTSVLQSPPPLEALCERLRLLRTEVACAVSKVQETETVKGDGHSSSSYSDYSDSRSSSSASSADEEDEEEDEASS